MNTKWKKNAKPRPLINDIISRYTLTKDNKVSYDIGNEILHDTLFNNVQHKFTLSPDVLFEEFTKAITKEFINDQKITAENNILITFHEACTLKLRKTKRYYLVTSISLNDDSVLKRRLYNNCTLSFYKNLPDKYSKNRADRIDRSEAKFKEHLNFMFVVISTEEPDNRTAAKSALDALDVIRSLIELDLNLNANLFANDREAQYPSQTRIKLGKYHTLHNTNGKAIEERLWFESNYIEEEPTKISNFSLVDRNLSTRLKQIKKNPIHNHLKNSLISFIEASDTKETISRFLKLWTSAEKLFRENQSSKELIKKMTFQHDDKVIAIEILNSMRETRNINIHNSVKPLNLELKTIHLKSMIIHSFKFFIKNNLNFTSLDEFLKFMSLPSDTKKIDNEIELLKKRKKLALKN